MDIAQKPTVFKTTDEVSDEHLGIIAKNLDDALEKPAKTKYG